VRHLINKGHRRIGIITGSLSLQTAKERLEGYRNALHGASIKPEPGLILEGDFREGSGYRLGKELLLSHQPPTAIFVSNGMMAVGVVRALEEIGLQCPGDIAIASFDDLPLASAFRPHLTAVALPAYQIGNKGAEFAHQTGQGGYDRQASHHQAGFGIDNPRIDKYKRRGLGTPQPRGLSPCGQNIHVTGLEFMMDVPHAREQMGSSVGVRHRAGQSETPAPK
jgi:ABC-type sugar transport system substrate-binding protein